MMKSVALVLCLAAFASAKLSHHEEHQLNKFLRQWIEPAIVGGDDAEHGEFPHMLQMQSGGSHRCGASILTEEWALTAAHCVEGMSPGSLKLVAGQHKLSEDDGTEQETVMEEIIIHPKYGSADYDYDIAVIKVKTPFKFNDNVNAIKLYTTPDTPRTTARTSGWGRTSAGGPIPNTLQKLNVTIYEDDVCSDAYGDIFTPNFLCAGNIEGGHCVCNGDSGSPLYIEQGGEKLQVGIVSWGYPCANAGYPAAYSEVGAFIDFVKEHVKLNY